MIKIKSSSNLKIKIVGIVVALLLSIKLFHFFFWSGFLFILLAVYLLFFSSGVQFDVTLMRFRFYYSHFGFKSGKWQDLNQYKGIILRTMRVRKSIGGPNIVQIGTEVKVSYSVLLVDETHRQQVEITSFSKLEEAQKMSASLSKELNLSIQKYNPTISEATKKRR